VQSLRLWKFLQSLAQRIHQINELTNYGKNTLSMEDIQKQSEVPEEYRLVNSLLILNDPLEELVRMGKNGGVQFDAQKYAPRWNYPLVLQARYFTTFSSQPNNRMSLNTLPSQ